MINESMPQCSFRKIDTFSHSVDFIGSFLRIAKYSALCRSRDLWHGFNFDKKVLSFMKNRYTNFDP